MNTLLLNSSKESILTAAKFLKSGGLCAIPTETVYGLAANALDSGAVAKIFAAKGRPQDNPLIVHIASLSMLEELVLYIPDSARRLTQRFWPGPLTIILPKSGKIPNEVSAGLDTVAVRMPAHSLALELITAAGVPLAAPSANLSGSPSPTCAAHVMADLNGRIDAVLDGGSCTVGVESTVITLASEKPRLLRPGAVTPEQLRELLGEVEIDPAVLSQLQAGEAASSPGMKYKHYAPKARITIIEGDLQSFNEYLQAYSKHSKAFALCFEGEEGAIPLPCVSYGRQECPDEQAARLFDALRRLDELGAERVFARCPAKEGLALAVYNRLLRAAGFDVRN
ncbi:MAG: threonylcarbamoyl-AMP synthase [Oscillospiraceae bacterium]|jgi:L-threonylcarbamoyladenylate synthase|nr:threonylcarbamoyl-AMP synthase [Oscillospiraceae bacterium]